jgi:hypothetical protein
MLSQWRQAFKGFDCWSARIAGVGQVVEESLGRGAFFFSAQSSLAGSPWKTLLCDSSLRRLD